MRAEQVDGRRTAAGMEDSQGAGPARGVAVALIAGILMWVVMLWVLELVMAQLYEQEDISGLVAMSWVGNFAGPVLSTIIIVLLLPNGVRGRIVPSVLVGTSVTIVGCGIGVLGLNGADQGQALLLSLGLVTLSALIAVTMAILAGRRASQDEDF